MVKMVKPLLTMKPLIMFLICSVNMAPMFGLNVKQKIFLPEGFTHPSSPNGIFTKETDIMDVWFDSGSSHQAVLLEREDLERPADLYLRRFRPISRLV